MKLPLLTRHRQPLSILTLSLIITTGVFIFQGHYWFNIADEGFLWYGVQRTMLGEVPIRDFMAYDPGRYYWSALLMNLGNNNGIVALRITALFFQAIGIFLGLIILTKSNPKTDRLMLLMLVFNLTIWMYPYYKVFDTTLSVVLIWVLSYLIERPNYRRHFLTGLAIGLVAVFGRNHGVYGVAGSLCTIASLAFRRNIAESIRLFFAWLVGVLVGYLPIWVMLIIVPGFTSAFLDSIKFLVEIKTTNLALPIPWPWKARFGEVPFSAALGEMLLGLFFVAIVAYGISILIWVIYRCLRSKSVSPVLMASALLSLPYCHYAFSRADVYHLAMGIFPFLVGTFGILIQQRKLIKWPLGIVLTSCSALLMVPQHDGWLCRRVVSCVDTQVGRDTLKIYSGTADEISTLKTLDKKFANGKKTFLATPFMPGAYAALGRKSPAWEIYALFPRSEVFQMAEIERIKRAKPAFVVIWDLPLDGRADLAFRSTNPLIYRYLQNSFEPVNGYYKDHLYQVLKEKD